MMHKVELRVFLASPGGLEDERNVVEDVANLLNSSFSDSLGVSISVRRFEHLTPRAGRPQENINPWVDECDLLIAVVHRRWGSPSGNKSDTGFSEEFRRAAKRYETTQSPEIAVYFKEVDEASLKDPGPQLAEVIKFRSEIEKNQKALYKAFANTDEFRAHVLHLLVEHMHIRGGRAEPGGDYVPSKTGAQVEAEVGEDGETSSSALETTLRSFTSLVTGEEPAIPADSDRLLLFAMSASRDNELMPVHLANRIASGEDIEDVRQIEVAAWLMAYIADIGRTRDPAARVFPLGQLARQKDVNRLLSDRAAELVISSEENIRSGAARICLALGERPAKLWNRLQKERGNVVEAWAQLFRTDVYLATDLWCAQSRPSDAFLLRALMAVDSTSTAQAAQDISALNVDQGSADGLLTRNDRHLVSEHVAQLVGRPVAELASTSVLAEIAAKRYAPLGVRRAAIAELLKRDGLPESYLEFLLDSTEEANPTKEPGLRELELKILRRQPAAALASAIRKITSRRKSAILYFPRIWHLARLPLEEDLLGPASDLFRQAALPQEAITFATSAGNAAQQATAKQWIHGDEGIVDGFTKPLKEAGYSTAVIDAITHSVQFAAGQYLHTLGSAGLDDDDVKALHALARIARHNSSDWRALLDLVDPNASLRMIVPTSSFGEPGRLEYLATRAKSDELKTLLSTGSTDVVSAVLAELGTRGTVVSRADLDPLLRHANAQIRLQATRIRYRRKQVKQLVEARRDYTSTGQNYFYNVVAEMDRTIAGLPEV